MEIKPIKTEADYRAAMEEVEHLFGAAPNTSEGDRLEAKERGHTYTPDNGGADRLVAEEMKQSKAVGMLERELGA